MSGAPSLQQLAARIQKIEDELRAVRTDVEGLQGVGSRRRPARSKAHLASLPRIEKRILRQWSTDLLQDLGIEAGPVTAEESQEASRNSDLEPNEISRDLIRMREE